jgi:ElaB/YqjD/DUF883 family membrane-anchored ribosome-binding protein
MRTEADKLMNDLKTVASDAEALLSATGEVVGAKADAARTRLRGTLESARNTCRHLEAKASERLDASGQAMAKRPFQSVGIALGVGVLLGLLLAPKD